MAEAAFETGKRGRKAAIKAEKQAEEAAEQTRPKGRRTKDPSTDATPTFWQKVAAVAKADWGPRANIYLYRVEPVIDRRRAGSQTYITKYAEPISEDRILADHGSGRYKLMLNFRKPGAEQGDEVDSLYLDLLNLNFPPKIAPGEWVEDPNNKKWAWAKQHYSKESGNGNNSPDLVQALDVLNEIQDSTTKRVLANLPPPTSGADEMVKIAKVLDTIRPPVPPAPPPDNTLATFLTAELASMRQMIDKSREREIDLFKEMINARANNGGGISVIKEVVGGLKELLPEVKNLFPFSEGESNRGSRLGPWGELAVQVIPHLTPIVTPFAGVLAQGLMAKMTGGNGNQPPQQQYPGQVPHPPQLPPGAAGAPPMMMPFLQSIAFPMQAHIRFLGPPENADPIEVGKEFALWVYNGYGSNPQYETAITAARAMGPVGIISAFRSTPLWGDKGPQNTLTSLAELEGKLGAFFTAFLQFDPQAEPEGDEAEETESAAPEVLTYSGV